MGYVQRTMPFAALSSGSANDRRSDATGSQSELDAPVRRDTGPHEAAHEALYLAPVDSAELSGSALGGLDDRPRRRDPLLRLDRSVGTLLGRRPA